MKFGVCLPTFPFGVRPSRDAIVEIAQEIDRLGYDSAWVSDHILVPRDKPRYGHLFEVLSTIAYVGALTEKIHLGTSILVLPYRNAIVVAKQAATIDALTGGRLILGVGAGWIEAEFRNVGADYHRRGRLLDEGLKVMKALWTQENPAVRGEFYDFSDTLFEPKPVGPEGIPIWVGGNSDAALRRVVRLGDAWHADDFTMEQLVEGMDKMKAMNNGRPVKLAMRRTTDLRAAIAMEARSSGVREGGWPGGTAGALSGTVEEVSAAIEEYARLGAEHMIFQFEHQTQEEHLAQIRFFAREIMPLFAD